MDQITSCWIANVAMSSVMVLVAVVSVVDCCVREVPKNPTKARVTLLFYEVVKVLRAVSEGRDDNVELQASLFFVFVAILIILLLYFFECFIVVWSTMLEQNVKNLWFTTSTIERLFTAGRVLGILYAIGLGIAFSLRPTNGMAIAARSGRILAFTMSLSISVFVAYLAVKIRAFRLSLGEMATSIEPHVGKEQDDKIRQTERRMMLFVVVNVIVVIITFVTEIVNIKDIAMRIDEPYEVVECSSVLTEALNHVAVFIGLTLLTARDASRRRISVTNKQRRVSGAGGDQVNQRMVAPEPVDLKNSVNNFSVEIKGT